MDFVLPVSRLALLSQDLSGTGADLALGFQYNKAGQITELTRSRDLYAFTAPTYGGTLYETGGLNQLTKVGAAVPTHDGRGNLTSDGTKSYSYSTENLLVTGPNGAALSSTAYVYDVESRLCRRARRRMRRWATIHSMGTRYSRS